MTFIPKNITANGINVSYLDEGTSSGLPLIFIHGFPFNKEMWTSQLTALSDNHRCIAYDVRGHGGSEAGAAQFGIPQFADDLFSIMDTLKIEKAIVVGLSMGGYIALHAVEKNATRLAGLILCDTQCAADTQEGVDKRKKTIAFIQKNGLEVYTEESLKNLFAPASLQSKNEKVSFIKNTILSTKPDNICLTLQALADRKEKCTVLKDINVPVLILVGKEDKITSPEAAEKMHREINGAEIGILDGAGHLSNLENPAGFNERIRSFLAQNFSN